MNRGYGEYCADAIVAMVAPNDAPSLLIAVARFSSVFAVGGPDAATRWISVAKRSNNVTIAPLVVVWDVTAVLAAANDIRTIVASIQGKGLVFDRCI